MSKRETCPITEEDCVQQENVEELSCKYNDLCGQLPQVKTDLKTLEGKISTYSKVALTFISILCGIATYGFFEISNFRKEYQVITQREAEAKLKFQTEVRVSLQELERKLYDKNEKLMDKLTEVEKSVAALAAQNRNNR